MAQEGRYKEKRESLDKKRDELEQEIREICSKLENKIYADLCPQLYIEIYNELEKEFKKLIILKTMVDKMNLKST